MLQNKYLSIFHIAEKHAVVIEAPPSVVWPLASQLDFSQLIVIRMLFALRGLPTRMLNRKGLEQSRFYVLEEIPEKEIIIGLIGKFWTSTGNLQAFEPREFGAFHADGFAKGTWSFELTHAPHACTVLTTETRVWCSTDVVLKKFRRYWFFIRPFSNLIRKAMLHAIKKEAEAATRTATNR